MSLFQKLKSLFIHTSKGEDTKNEFSRLYEDEGRFSYDHDGFYYHFSEGVQKILWSEIERMRAYKADLLTIDQLRLDIEFRNLTLPISEDTPGFYQFVIKTKEVFSTIAKDWDMKIIHPAFEANDTVIYERKQQEPFSSI